MKLSKLKSILNESEGVILLDTKGKQIPPHFHITEVGLIAKKFIDCGGTIREEKRVNFQLWHNEADQMHQLSAKRILKIIGIAESQLNIPDEEIEIEYQTNSIGKYGLSFNGTQFQLVNTLTACLAGDQCVPPQAKKKINLTELTTVNSCSNNSQSNCCLA